MEKMGNRDRKSVHMMSPETGTADQHEERMLVLAEGLVGASPKEKKEKKKSPFRERRPSGRDRVT